MIPLTYYTKTLEDDTLVEVVPLTFGRARILIGDGYSVRDSW